VLCNFVLSYVEDARQFFEMGEPRSSGQEDLFSVTDVHPKLLQASICGGEFVRGRISRDSHPGKNGQRGGLSLPEGKLHVATFLEARFGDEERVVFRKEKGRRIF